MKSLRAWINIVENVALLEEMQSISGLALYIRDAFTGLVVLYDPQKAPKPSCIMATATFMQYSKEDIWIVGSVLAKNGYGPLVYAIIAQIVANKHGILIPSDDRSNASVNMWNKFGNNPFVKIVPIADQQTSSSEVRPSVSYNISPTRFGIVGNDSLDLAAAIDANRNVDSEKREIVVRNALDRKRTAMRKLRDN